MTSDLEQRLHNYRTRLDDAIADDLAERDAPPLLRPSKRRSLVGAAAVAIVAVGVGAIAWTATNSADNSQQSEVPATTTPLEAEPPFTDAPPAGTALDDSAPGDVAAKRIALGSSVMLGAAEDLVELGFVVDATESRQFRDVVDLTASLAATGTVGDVVVIHAATNGTIQADDLDEVASNLADVGNVYLVTDALQREWVEPNNELMRSLAASNSNVTVIDWATEASSCPGDCFYPDNFHLRPDGQRYYAQLVHEATSEAASWTVEPGAVDPSSTSFTATVTRTGCSGGRTGTVYPPTLDMSGTSIVVTFRVEPLDPRFDYTCPTNDAVAATVTLPEPIGQRQLVDGVCAETDGAACEFGAIRWDPEPSLQSHQEPTTPSLDLNADVDVDSLVYDVDGLTRDQRTGSPRPSPEVVKLLEPIREAYGGIAVGDEFDLDFVIAEETYRTFTFLPVVRTFGAATYLIGWVDQTQTGTSPPGEPFKANIEFVYDDNGLAIGSMPFPESLPESFPLPAHLEPLRT